MIVALRCVALRCVALPCLALPCLALRCLALPCLALPDCPNVCCLEPHDLAAAKCQVGRPKDLDLLIALVQSKRLDPELVRERLRGVQMTEQRIRSSHENLDQVIREASK